LLPSEFKDAEKSAKPEISSGRFSRTLAGSQIELGVTMELGSKRSKRLRQTKRQKVDAKARL